MRSFVLVLFTLAAAAQDAPSLRDLLGRYGTEMSGGGFSNTIPVEQAIVRARNMGDFKTLAEFAGHKRFGPEILWALGEARQEEAKALAAFSELPAPVRAQAALSIGAYRSDAARKALATLLADPELNDWARRRVRSALLRAEEPQALAAAKAALGGKDVEKVADALLLPGDARATGFLEDALRRASDKTKLAQERESIFEQVTTTRSPDGMVTETKSYPALVTLGDVALEAASRMVASTTPEQMAWWLDVERGPRFGPGAEGSRLLRQWIEEDRKARKARAIGAEEALRALMRSLRERTPEDPIEMRLLSVAFDKSWTFRYRAAGDEATATVDAAGRVEH